MASVQLINTQTVINYMLTADNMQFGCTPEDIMAATGLSKSTVYRIIKKHPAIIRLEMPGKRARYQIDHNGFSQAVEPVKVDRGSKHSTKIPVESSLVKFIQNLDPLEFANKMREYTKDEFAEGLTKFDFDKAALSKAMQMSWDFQNGTDSIDPSVMAQARISLDRLQSFAVFLYFYSAGIKRHGEYLSETEWWAIWPKD